VTENTAYNLAKLALIVLGIQLFVIGYVFYQSYQGRLNIVTTQRLGCERGKKDRGDNADFQQAQKQYIDKVVLAGSVKEDVKDAAREAVKTFERTSNSLSERALIDCHKAFPDAKLIP
jgi:hypothetical protein